MILHAVAVRDLATDSFNRPFFVQHSAQAVRSFSDECNNKDSDIFRHSQDYELWLLGSFDDSSGLFASTAERLARAIDLRKD